MTLAVADSSYITKGLLKDSSLFKGYVLCSPDYGLYEILNAVWKHEALLKKVKESGPILDMLFDLVDAERIRFVALTKEACKKAYELAVKTKTPIYDVGFMVLARELGVELKTFDARQAVEFSHFAKSEYMS